MAKSAAWMLILMAACSSPAGVPALPLDPSNGPASVAGCYRLHLGAEPSPDVPLPGTIELLTTPASGFVEPGRYTVREPGAATARAPISWWIPRPENALELVLGGGYTGYTFELRQRSNGHWVGEGTYWADMGLLPEPMPLPLRLEPQSCSGFISEAG